MLSSFSSPICQLRRDRQGYRVYLGDQSIEGTVVVSAPCNSSQATATHHTPSLLVVMNIYLFVESI